MQEALDIICQGLKPMMESNMEVTNF